MDLENQQDEELLEEQVEEQEESSSPEQTEELEASEEDSEQVEQEQTNEPEEEKPTPFHEHPRFKELVEQKNEFKTQADRLREEAQQTREQLIKLQAQFEVMHKPEPQEDPMLAQLREVNPDFAAHYEAQIKKASEVDELKQQIMEFNEWRAAEERKSAQREANTIIGKLYEEHGVPEKLRTFYEASIEREAQLNPSLQISDLPKVFSKIHEGLTEYVKAQTAQEKKEYLQAKKAVAKKPQTQPKGAPVSQGGDKIPEFKTVEDRKAWIVAQTMKQLKEETSL